MAISPSPRSERKTLTMKKSALKVAAVAAMVAGFAATAVADWTYDGGKMTDGSGWELTATVKSGKITISGFTADTAQDVLDLRGTVSKAGDPSTTYTITVIGGFKNTAITTLYLPDTVTSFSDTAFSGCTSLTTIEPFLPSSVTSIGQNSFANCSALACSLELGVGDGGDVTLHRYGSCFLNSGITAITLGPRVTTVSTSAFQGCSKAVKLTLSEGLTDIVSAAFSGCSALKTVEPFLPSTVKTLGKRAFNGCTVLESPLVMTNPDLVLDSSSNYATFWNAKKIPSVDLSQSGLTVLNAYTFQGMSALEWLDLPASLATINNNVVNGCTALNKIVFRGTALTTFGDSVFSGVTDYKVRMYVPRQDSGWTTWAAANVSELDATAQGKYEAAYPGEPLPKGVVLNGSKHVFYFEGIPGETATQTFVLGDPTTIGADDGVEYGAFDQKGEAKTYASVAQAMYEGVLYSCKGYRLDVETAEDVWTEVENGPEISVTVQPDAQSRSLRLIWFWQQAGFTIKVTAAGGGTFGSVAVEPAKQMYVKGDKVTVTATPASGMKFLRWLGELPDESMRESATLNLEPEDAVELTAVFQSDVWIYDEAVSTTQMTDGNWTLNISKKNGNVTVSSVASVGDPYELNLRKPIVGADLTVTQLGDDSLNGQSGLVRLLLPDGLTSIGARSFNGCTSLSHVEPFLPNGITYIPQQLFYNRPVTNDLFLGMGEGADVSFGGNYCFNGVNSERITLGPRVKSTGSQAFANSKSLVEVTLSEGLVSVGAETFSGCSALTNIVNFLPSTVEYVGSRAFTCSALQTPLVVKTPGNVTYGNGNGLYGSFWGASSLPSADYSQSGITSLTNYIFQSCGNLREIRLPATFERLDPNVIASCSKMSAFYFAGSRPEFRDDCFSGGGSDRLRLFLPKSLLMDSQSGWSAFVAAATPMDDDYLAKYRKTYPDGRKPLAVYPSLGGATDVWLMKWSDKPFGFSVLVR